MNIFGLDPDSIKSTRIHCDKHAIKMILEYVQIMCSVWARESKENYD